MITTNKKKYLFLASSLCLSFVLILNMSCRKMSKPAPAPKEDIIDPVKLCEGKTEAEILNMPAFLKLNNDNNISIIKNTAGEVIQIYKNFRGKTGDTFGLELMVCFQKLEVLSFSEEEFNFFNQVVPRYITQIPSLKRLEFWYSKMRALPVNIEKLRELHTIKIVFAADRPFKNPLTESFYRLEKLQYIYIANSNLPDDVKNRINQTFLTAKIVIW
jgi:hypothetical protein